MLISVAPSSSGLDACFQHTHTRELADGDQFVTALWARVAPQLQAAVTAVGVPNVPRVHHAELSGVRRIIDVEVPELRRLSAPALATVGAHSQSARE